jgi:hypothetical protein
MLSTRFFKDDSTKASDRISGTCGQVDKEKSDRIYRMLSQYFDSVPNKPQVISVGSGYGYHELQLKEKVGLPVSCYDKENEGCLLDCQEAIFPEDNKKVIPINCHNVILFSAYPEGYLGELLKLYKERGGMKLCVVAEGSLLDRNVRTHLYYEPDYRLNSASTCLLFSELHALKEQGITQFLIGGCVPGVQVLPTYIEFYGDWDHKRLDALLQSQQEGAMASGFSASFSR